MSDILTELREHLGVDAVLDRGSLHARARNFWDPSPLAALALVRPRSTEDLSCIMRICHAREQSVVVHGGLTGVCDADRAGDDDLVVSFERMAAIDGIDSVGRTVTVQAGCHLEHLQRAVERAGLYSGRQATSGPGSPGFRPLL